MGKPIVSISILLFWGWVGPASTNDEEQFNEALIEDAKTVEDAVENIKDALEQQGFDIMGVVDHAENARSIATDPSSPDEPLPPTQLILFSDKRQENLLIRRGQTAAIDLPQKILVWEEEGKNENEEAKSIIHLFYNGVGYLVDRHSIRLRDFRLKRIANTLKQFGELENGLITVDSPDSVDDTADRLIGVLESRGFRIPFDIDFRANSTSRILKIRPTRLLIFGNPAVGTPLMQNQRRMGVDLPQKFLVWEDRESQVHITYNDIFFLAKRHGLQGVDERLRAISTALETLATTSPEE